MEEQLVMSKKEISIKFNQLFSKIKKDLEGRTSVSIYDDDPLSESTYIIGKKYLKENFNNFTEQMSLILITQLREEGFTNKRFMDAIKYLINTHKYPNITIANVLQFDNVINLKTYLDIMKSQKEFGNTIWNYYERVDIKGNCYYIHKDELKNNGIKLPKYEPKKPTLKIKPEENYGKLEKGSLSAIFNKTANEFRMEQNNS